MSVPHWRTAVLVAAALAAGAIAGPPLAQAAATATGLVRIEGGGSTHVAKVSTSGQLSVNTGLAATPAGQLQVAEASPAALVTEVSAANCGAGGFYAPPKGKALIITAVNFYDLPAGQGAAELALYEGPQASPCGSQTTAGLVADSIQEADASQNQVFPSGIVVPAGDALGLAQLNDSGHVQIYGYLVPG